MMMRARISLARMTAKRPMAAVKTRTAPVTMTGTTATLG
jgi:hypothetical protein